MAWKKMKEEAVGFAFDIMEVAKYISYFRLYIFINIKRNSSTRNIYLFWMEKSVYYLFYLLALRTE